MKFAVVASKRYEVNKYKERLKNFNLSIETAYDQMVFDKRETCELLYIEINSLEDLLKLKETVCEDIILMDHHYDDLDNYYAEPTIEIYDNYRK